VPPPAAPVPAPPPVAAPLIPAVPQEVDRTPKQTPATSNETATAEPSGKQTAPAAAKPKPTDVTAVGETVQIVQLALAKKGYNPGPANGRAGIKTQTAIRKFQKDSGVQPTGAIDYTLLEKLGIVGPRVHAFRPPPGATAGR
jgi:peptidoglycan hydrolase-like protein with peptidoglycan-binding domain